MVPVAYFGINSSAFSVAVDLIIIFLVVVYLALVYWTYADAKRRIEDPLLIGCATAAALFPFAGPVVYAILRPPEYLEDARERELEIQAAEARLAQLDYALCPHCDYRVERDFLRCPSCLRKLKERCASCSRPLDESWTICPYCEAEVPGAVSSRARRRHERAAQSSVPPRRAALGRDGGLRRESSITEDPLAFQDNGADGADAVIGGVALSNEDLLGQTVESDALAFSADVQADGSASVGASAPLSGDPRPRRSRRPSR